MHKLRIECKKLRYLFESFSSLYPKKKLAAVLKRLKFFQDKLGNLNDLVVQEQMLSEYLATMQSSENYSIEIAAAIGGLITKKNQNKHKLRVEFEQALQEYMQRKDSRQFERIADG
jgi:CHAD domain-containing protein